jgi:hexosaminidase
MLTALLLIAIAPWGVETLWPIPRSLQTGSSLLKISPSFDIHLNINKPPKDLLDAVSRTKSYIHTDKLQRLVVGRGANDSVALARAPTLHGLSVSLNGAMTSRAIAVEAVQPLAVRSEGYSLHVPNDGSSAVLTANSTLGLFRGLTTFEQLWYDLGGVTYSYQVPVAIVNDVPAYVSPSMLLLRLCWMGLIIHIQSRNIEDLCLTRRGTCESSLLIWASEHETPPRVMYLVSLLLTSSALSML